MATRDAYEIAPGVVRIEAPLPFGAPASINCYLLRLAEGDVLVDTGMRGSEVAIDAALEQFDARVESVVLTHGHPDHWGLARRYSSRVRAHPHARTQIAFAETPDPTAQGALSGRRIDEALLEVLTSYRELTEEPPEVEPIAEGERVGDWDVLFTPGHAPGHICLHRRRDGILIAGDHVLPAVTPNIHLTLDTPDAVKDYMQSLRRVARLFVTLVLPAHGEPFADARRRTDELIAHHEQRLGRLEQLLADGPADIGRLSAALFRGVQEPSDVAMAEMETHAHLEHLRLQGRVALLTDPSSQEDRWASHSTET